MYSTVQYSALIVRFIKFKKKWNTNTDNRIGDQWFYMKYMQDHLDAAAGTLFNHWLQWFSGPHGMFLRSGVAPFMINNQQCQRTEGNTIQLLNSILSPKIIVFLSTMIFPWININSSCSMHCTIIYKCYPCPIHSSSVIHEAPKPIICNRNARLKNV